MIRRDHLPHHARIPLAKPAGEGGGAIRHLIGQIVGLRRIVGDVIELRRLAPPQDEFPVALADRAEPTGEIRVLIGPPPVGVEVVDPEEPFVRHAGGVAPEVGNQIDAVERPPHINTRRRRCRGTHVHAVDHRCVMPAGRHHARPADDKGHADAPLEDVELLPAVRTVRRAQHRWLAAVVAQEKHERAVVDAGGRNRIQHAAHRGIEPADERRRHPPFAVEVGEAVEIGLLGLLLEVRRHEGDVEEERPLGMVGDERRGAIGEHVVHPAGMDRPLGARDERRIDVFSRRPDPAAERIKTTVERPVVASAEVPLPDQSRVIALLAQQLRQQHFAEVHGRRGPVQRPVVFDAKPTRITTGEQGGPRG